MNYKKGHWAHSERKYLKDNYNHVPIEEIIAKLNRSPSSITSQVHYLRKRGWTFNRIKDNG